MKYKIILLWLFAINSIATSLADSGLDSLSMYMSKIQQQNEAEDYVSALKTMIVAEDHINSITISTEQKSNALIQLNIQPVNIEFIEQQNEIDNYELGRAYEYYATRLLLTGDYNKAETYYQKALPILTDSNENYRVYKWLGLMYGVSHQTVKAVQSYKKAIESVKQNFDINDPEGKKLLFVLNTNIQSGLLLLGNYKLAKQHIHDALSYSIESNNEYNKVVAYINLASLNTALQDHDNVFKALNVVEPLVKNYRTLTMSFNNIKANAYFEKEEYDSSKLYFQKSIDMVKPNDPNQSSKLINRAAIADIHFLQKKYRQSLTEFTGLIEDYSNLERESNSNLAEIYFRRSKIYTELGILDSAIINQKKAMSFNGEYKTWKIRPYSNLSNIYKAYYIKSKKKEYVDSILQSINVTDNYIDSMRHEHRFYENEINLNSFLFEAYAVNLDCLYEVYKSDKPAIDFEKIFGYFEKIKSYSHKEYLKTDNAVKEGMLPQEFLDRERAFKIELGSLKKQLFLNQQSKTDPSENLPIHNNINQKETEYNLFLKELETTYPNYFKFQYDQYNTNLKEVQNQLNDNEAIIEYYMALNAIYILSIESNSCQFHKIDIDKKWKDNFNSFLKLLSLPSINTKMANEPKQKDLFVKNASDLYKEILGPVISVLKNDIQHLTIVADNQLNFLPFEILLTEFSTKSESYSSLPYLIKKFNISYDSSVADNILSKKKAVNRNKVEYSGFAPQFSNDYIDLPYTRNSVNTIADLYKGIALTTANLTREEVEISMSQANIIHFATHGVVDQINPATSHLVISNKPEDKLYVSDIYAKKINANLAVLSACQTGIGKFQKGDGIQNISRAFRFAGVQSTIMSLWPIPDVQAAKIDLSFFQNIEKGLRKDEALRLAKLNYIEEAPKAFTHPFYWAGVIPLGNMEPIIATNNWTNKIFYVLMLILALLIGFKLFQRK